MEQQRDYYDVLGVQRNADAEAIRKAYRQLARELHPDVNESPDAATRFAELQEAYAVLSDAEKRKSYDRFGRAGVGVGVGVAVGKGGCVTVAVAIGQGVGVGVGMGNAVAVGASGLTVGVALVISGGI